MIIRTEDLFGSGLSRLGVSKVKGLAGTTQDITDKMQEEKMRQEKMRQEKNQRENEKRFKLSSESGGIGLWELNLADRTVWRSLKHDQIFGYESLLPDWTYEIFLKHVVEEDRPMVAQKFGKALELLDTWDFECRIKRKDGVERWILARGNPEIDEKQRPIKMFGTVQDITDRKKVEIELQNRIKYQEVLFEISSAFAGLKMKNVDRAINKTLSTIGHFTKTERAYVFQYKNNHTQMDNTHEWCAEGIESQITNLKDIVVEDELPWFIEHIKKGEIFQVPDVSAMPEDAALEKKHFQSQNIKSLIVVPIQTSENLFGFLGFDAVHKLREWNDDHKSLLQYFSQTLCHIIGEQRIELKLRKREFIFSQTFEQSSTSTCFYDREGTIFRVNQAFCEMFGVREQDILNSRYNMFKDQTIIEAGVLPIIREIFENNKVKNWEIDLDIQKESSSTAISASKTEKISLKVFGHPVVNHQNALEFVVLKHYDITDRKKAEQKLIESESHLKILVDTIPDLIWLKNPEGVYLSCNPTFERFFGATEKSIVGKTDYDFVDKKLADSFRSHDRNAMELNRPTINEECLTFSDDGSIGLFETVKTPMRTPDGKLIGVLGIARDITERKESEEFLRKNEQRYKSAQRMGKVGNWEYDLVTKTFWGSDQAKRIYGFDPEIDRFPIGEVENCIPERERVHQALIDLIEKETLYNLEFDIHPISGPEIRTVRSIAEVFRDDTGTPLKIIGLIQDITEQKKSIREKEKLERQLIHGQKMESIGNLAGGIAHDFNNILSSIIGFTELAFEEVEKKSLLEDCLQEVYAAGKRAKELVKQILAFARQSEEKAKPLQVSVISKEVLKLIRSSIPTTIKIKQNIQSDSLFMGNPTQVHQVLMNLCTNAAFAMEEKGGLLELSIKDVSFAPGSYRDPLDLKAGDYIQITVSDTGTGISPKTIDSIFEPYFTTKSPGEGTGMGLAMAQGIVENYGGKITVSSTLGQGSTFLVYIPISKRREPALRHKPEGLVKGSETILFVDDEAPIAKMGKRLLEQLGYSVKTRTSSVEALALFRSKPEEFDLVITDMTMPNMTGEQLAIALMKIRSDIPVVLCTGYSKNISDETVLEIGIKALTYKPIIKADLAKTVRKVLDDAKPQTHQ